VFVLVVGVVNDKSGPQRVQIRAPERGWEGGRTTRRGTNLLINSWGHMHPPWMAIMTGGLWHAEDPLTGPKRSPLPSLTTRRVRELAVDLDNRQRDVTLVLAGIL